MAKRTQPLIADRHLEHDPLQEFLASRWSRIGIATAGAALVAARLGGVAFAYEHGAADHPYQPDSMAGYDPGYDSPQWVQVDDKGKGGHDNGGSKAAPAPKHDDKPAPAPKAQENKSAPQPKAESKPAPAPQNVEPPKHEEQPKAQEQPKHEAKVEQRQAESSSGTLPGGTMGKSHSNPDGGGVDKPYAVADQAAGSQANTGFQDGNNGCGQDKHIDGGGDDNNGWCGAKPKPAHTPKVVFSPVVPTATTGGSTGAVNPCLCDTSAQITVDDKDRFFFQANEHKKDKIRFEGDQNDTSAIKVKAGDVDRVSMHFTDKSNLRVKVDDHSKVTFKIADKDRSKVQMNVSPDNPNAGSIKLNLNDSQNVHFVCDTDENGNVTVNVNVTERGKVHGDQQQQFFNVNFGGEDKFHWMVADKDRQNVTVKTSGTAKDTLVVKTKNEDKSLVNVTFDDQSNIKFQTADNASFHVSDKVKDKIEINHTSDKSGSMQLNGVDAHNVTFVCHFDENGNLHVDVDTVPTTTTNPGTVNANPTPVTQPVAVTTPVAKVSPDTDKVTICHATGSATNPFVTITIPWVAAIKAHLPISAGGDTIGGGGHSGPGGEDFILMNGGTCENPQTTTGGGANVSPTPTVIAPQANPSVTPSPVANNGGGNATATPVPTNVAGENASATPVPTNVAGENATSSPVPTTVSNGSTNTTASPVANTGTSNNGPSNGTTTSSTPSVAEVIVANGPLTPGQASAVANVLGGGLTGSQVQAMTPGEIQSTAVAAGVSPQAISGALAAPVEQNTGMASANGVSAGEADEATLGEQFSRGFNNVVASVMPSTGEPALGIFAASLAALGGAGLFLRRIGRR